MTRYALDSAAAMELIRGGAVLRDDHRLVAPNGLRSHLLDRIYREVLTGDVSSAEAAELLDRVTTLKVRLLGDRVSRATAWRFAERLGQDSIGDAEYLAVAHLQADRLIALDASVRDAARRLGIATAPLDEVILASDPRRPGSA
jgi:predicted nucleic acid-binding protein